MVAGFAACDPACNSALSQALSWTPLTAHESEGKMAVLGKATPERLSAFSDGVFAVLITVLVATFHSGCTGSCRSDR